MTTKEKAAKPAPAEAAANAPAPAAENSGSEIDHLRTILFGNHAQATNSRLTDLENELPALKNQLLQRLEADLSAANKQHQELRQEVKGNQKSQQQELAQTRQALQDLINQTEATFTRQLQELRAEWGQRLQMYQEEVSAQLEKLQTMTRRQDEALRAELLAATSYLDERKATRTDLGQMLIELGSQLQTNTQHISERAE